MARSSRSHKNSPGVILPQAVHPASVGIRALLIAAATLWIYGPSLDGGWLWDDNLSITQNSLLNDPARLWKTWFAPGNLIEYYPVEQTVQWIQWQLWGDHPFGYRLTNVAFHVADSLLAWRLFSKLGLRLAWLGGLIFAIHPLQVESVAWISEFKNTLSTLPFLLSMCAYIDYEENQRNRDYWLSLGLFLVAMLCKNSMAFFPAVILLHAWWKKQRIGLADLKACAPFFFVAVTLAAMNIGAGNRFLHLHNPSPGSTPLMMMGPMPLLALAGLTVSFYFTKFFWPIGLLAIYPAWTVDPASWAQLAAWPLFGAALYWLWRNREGCGRHGLLGLGFFLLGLGPVFVLIATRYSSLVWSLDHMAYLPSLGLIGLTVAILGRIYARLPLRAHLYGIVILTMTMTLLLIASRGYADAFINSETLWNYTLQHSPASRQLLP